LRFWSKRFTEIRLLAQHAEQSAILIRILFATWRKYATFGGLSTSVSNSSIRGRGQDLHVLSAAGLHCPPDWSTAHTRREHRKDPDTTPAQYSLRIALKAH
jgi:hypothetical protein